MPKTAATPKLVPVEKDQYRTDGERLVQVLDTVDSKSWIEDARTLACEEIPTSQLKKWEVVKHDGKR